MQTLNFVAKYYCNWKFLECTECPNTFEFPTIICKIIVGIVGTHWIQNACTAKVKLQGWEEPKLRRIFSPQKKITHCQVFFKRILEQVSHNLMCADNTHPWLWNSNADRHSKYGPNKRSFIAAFWILTCHHPNTFNSGRINWAINI